jgi:predicted kinase
VVADATNVSRRRRAPWIALGRELGVPVEAYVIAPDLAACRSRNGSPGGPGEPVPDEVLERMAARWEPVEEEGVAVRRV